jgi:general stress protein CsbA
MKNEKLISALAACLTLVLIGAWATKGTAENLWWAVILMIFLGPVAVGGYVIAFYIVGSLSQRLKMDGFLFHLFASTVLGSLVFALPTGCGFLTAFSRGQFNPKLIQWGMERALMVVGATGGAMGGITFYVTKQILALKTSRPSQKSMS